ncbi:SusC/RagA family TonB-linked outer membrane protein [Belliella sp. DSM 111904]|uniref:SusC/RagA family TonB-linked outer membrane protein n=1 Tax=Belliella filtrata TaxID=2923435 RepID=A0ABS9V0P9_9BACT|nr:SusC/RagA family TonB-linked outer membrane protein [Belliella filtrata]MCH7409983.1 SusC/RagA family TonB-linked outer membrane protein [Belliella filtrata]
MKIKLYMMLLVAIFLLPLHAYCQNLQAKLVGSVYENTENQPLIGASVWIVEAEIGAITDDKGGFELNLAHGRYNVEVTYLGFEKASFDIQVPISEPLLVYLEGDGFGMDEVTILSTGYQQLPKERATGSFVHLDETLITRSVGPNILDRLADVTSGLVFNQSGSGSDPISIRGRSTLFANANPLVVIDGFPYDGPLENINPNNVESITVLKDAAAASIWGARAGNGVIVISMKKGSADQPMKVSINNNVIFRESPDFYYRPRMSVSDYIDTEQRLFDNGFFRSREISQANYALSPAVELMILNRDGLLTESGLSEGLERLKSHDIRDDYKYFYRSPIHQQHSANVSGGGAGMRYNLSASYDNNLNQLIGNSDDRFTLGGNYNFSMLNDKLTIGVGFYLTQGANVEDAVDPTRIRLSALDALYPYAKLVGEDGLPVSLPIDYRTSFISGLEGTGLLDWTYSPLGERGLINSRAEQSDKRFILDAGYSLLPGLKFDVKYQYWDNREERTVHHSQDSYFSRDLINRFSRVLDNGSINRPIPVGGVYDFRHSLASSHTFRSQLNYNKSWGQDHQVVALGGFEAKDYKLKTLQTRQYGYNQELATVQPVDYINTFPQFQNPSTVGRIPYIDNQTGITDRFVSYFFNASYFYKDRYIVTASARKDMSNLYGVESNQKGVPLWSSGLGWIISEESFFNLDNLPYLKLRTSYGFNGNTDRTLTALTTATFFSSNFFTGLPYANITNPPNPNLRWEKSKMVNYGIDFSTKDGRIEGSIEYYQRNGYDLVGFAPVAPSSGMRNFKGNTASSEGSGVDVEIKTVNLNRRVVWTTNWLFNYYEDKIVNYGDEHTVRTMLQFGASSVYPLEGYGMFPVFSYQWAGLNPDTGDPMGYLDGEVSQDYAAINRETVFGDLIFHGTARPNVFGAIRNNLNWLNFSLSFNISYRLGYYYRRESIRYGNNFGLGGHGDYAYRWLSPGDELVTNVPSLPSATNNLRDDLYNFSSALIERGDHIRLQDIRLSYLFEKKSFPRLPFQRAEVYSYVNNIGILWKASDDPLDPDFRTMKPLRSIAFGLRVDF